MRTHRAPPRVEGHPPAGRRVPGPPLAALVLAALAASGAGCARAHDLGSTGKACTNWKDDVEPLVAEHCTGCHGGYTPAAGYDMSSYPAALGRHRDGPAPIIAGDSQSRVLTVLRRGASDDLHHPLDFLLPTLETWIVECRASYFDSAVHPGGFLNWADRSEFHGQEVRNRGWDFQYCARCHGNDFGGRGPASTCYACHADGPLGCSTCHVKPPSSGAHTVHLTAPATHKELTCADCHRVPTRWDQPGHILDLDGQPIPSAQVTFGERARWGRDGGPADVPPPQFSGGVCSNVYCHGGTLNDDNAQHPNPRWETPAGATTCGSCHGQPPVRHPTGVDCASCHPRVIAQGSIIAPELHLDGRIDVGADGTGRCDLCHAGPQTVPFRNLAGSTDRADPSVGAHESHLRATHRLSNQVTCDACHRLPARVGSAGHVDDNLPAEVFPAGFGGLGAAGNASPVYDRTSGTCSATYCHGGGERLQDDQAPYLRRTVNWTEQNTGYVCGTCHGFPPQDPSHNAQMEFTGCMGCHASTVDEYGRIKFNTDGTTTHLNGVIDAP